MSEKRKTKIISTQSSKKEQPKRASVNKKRIGGTKEVQQVEMLFKRENYYFVFAGLLVMAIGFMLMSGGHMPSPDVWDDSLIYSFRRVFLAPLVILIGLGLNIYAIFKNN